MESTNVGNFRVTDDANLIIINHARYYEAHVEAFRITVKLRGHSIIDALTVTPYKIVGTLRFAHLRN